jgi:EthD domain
MFKVAWLLRRKPGITHDQFREHYETSHAVLGQKHFGHLITSYTRNYNPPSPEPGPDATPTERLIAATRWDYDCITEWEMRDEAALDEVFALLLDPVIGRIFHDDEEHFLDRSSVRLVRCDVRRTKAPERTAG